jgi:2-polyprenyl-6-methoxyphenol hydroxylase-like FAD-dependent oxidoreductase
MAGREDYVSIGRQAVVVGAGMGGLAAARALANHFERVLVLERDGLPADSSTRAGVPQGKHVHLLLAGGERALSGLFAGFEEHLLRAGVVPIRVGFDLLAERPSIGTMPQRDLGIMAYAMSRPLLELTVRQRAQATANVELRQRCRVQERVHRGPAVTGVRYLDGDGTSQTVDADLTVDATGRGTLTFALLEATGRAVPGETTLGVDLNYSTAVFAIPEDAPKEWKGVFTLPGPDGRGALMIPLEGRRWILTVGGRHGVKPPGDEAGFMEYTRQLRTQTIFRAIAQAKRLGEIERFGFSTSTYRHYEKVSDFPAGLLPLGDAICKFNPVYGQGMSVAAQEALALDTLLTQRATAAKPLDGLATAFFAEAAALIETPWLSAAIPDLLHPEARGERPENFEQMLRFGLALGTLAVQDPAIHRLTTEVQQLLKPRSVYQDPDLVQRVLAVMAEQS